MVKKMSREKLLQVVQSVPMLSPSAGRLMQITAQPDHDLEEVINLVKTDANLTARVLRVVNSAAFGLVNQVTSIDRAVAYLGERIIISIAVGDCAGKLFNKELSGYEAAGGDLWKHDLRTAIAAREVVAQSGADINSELAFTAGLLHDIGKAIMSDYLQGSVPEAVEMITREDSLDYLDAEEQLVGFDHTRAGYELARAWKLPEDFAEVILNHHEPAKADEKYRALVYAVHLGDNIAMMGGFGTGADSMRYKLDPGYTEYIHISPNTLANIMLTVDIEFEKLEESFSGSGDKN
ncbi:MAG: HDOD domain-containing protein [Desulfuromonadales bacterium]|nr:HDOD domain-containing protein [Desulfuromonadales bacterium]MBN2791532.1 HDOD domain-containing protein [Desulfuromonadales bacterium]